MLLSEAQQLIVHPRPTPIVPKSELEAYGVIAQGQLNGFSILDAFNHFLDHSVCQGEAEDFRYLRAGLRRCPREISQRQAGLWNGEERHFERFPARNLRVVCEVVEGSEVVLVVTRSRQ